MKNLYTCFIALSLVFCLNATAQNRLSFNNGHSHNDYHQQSPLLNAYQAGMGSIEADIFLRNGLLCVAHDSTDISADVTLRKMYLEPLAESYTKSGQRPYADDRLNLQLVIDIKENHQQVLPVLIRELEAFDDIFNSVSNPKAISIVISGDMPLPAAFKNYPDYISFDGRPYIRYSKKELKRIAMISDDLKKYTKWKGLGLLPKSEQKELKALVSRAHQLRKPFRFWGTKDNPETWAVLEKLGVNWINTDQPGKLRQYFLNGAY